MAIIFYRNRLRTCRNVLRQPNEPLRRKRMAIIEPLLIAPSFIEGL